MLMQIKSSNREPCCRCDGPEYDVLSEVRARLKRCSIIHKKMFMSLLVLRKTNVLLILENYHIHNFLNDLLRRYSQPYDKR